ncbi:MAG: ABC transporter ATP-binding protein [Gammaproteobacteria bacterium]|nr:MAG: ABC transporter ATP-binding protein [Gammaproteobacteria bacterium]RLD89487.1 MAG: ABC transporter ATP-binding protein [Bacteroidota bacterium]
MIKINSLSKAFKKQEVIKNLTIDFNAGEKIALIGQNGAGKTTLIRCILGQYNYEGHLEIMGMNPRKERRNILQNVGFVPQTPPPLKMTVDELLNFFVNLTNTPKEEFISLTHSLGLIIEENINKPFFKLSGGMKQKLLIALALGRQPKILLLDEPSANLDPQAREILFDHLQNFRKDSLMILSSHRMNEIKTLVNRVVEMDLGIVAVDKTVITETKN